MQDQLITLETAKLAKEKGFDFRVFNSYNEEGIIEQNNQELMYELFANRHLPKGSISAPTQSLLQKWLRETYDIHVWVNSRRGWSSIKHSYTDHVIHGLNPRDYQNEKMIFNNTVYSSYEEALEIGLQEALKLIKT